MANVDELLEHLDASHYATIASHQSHNDRSSMSIALYCLLDHLVAAIAIISVQDIEQVGIGSLALLLKLALNVPGLV